MEPLGGLRSVNRTLLVLFLFTAIVFSQPRLEMGVQIDAPIVGPLTTYSSRRFVQTLLHAGFTRARLSTPPSGFQFPFRLRRDCGFASTQPTNVSGSAIRATNF